MIDASDLVFVKHWIESVIAKRAGRSIPVTVKHVINGLWENENCRPIVHKEIKTKDGYDLVITLPVKISHNDFLKKLDYFKDATGVQSIEHCKSGKAILLRFSNAKIKNKYAFGWDYPMSGDLPLPIGEDSTGNMITMDLADIVAVLIGGMMGGGKSGIIHVWLNCLLQLYNAPLIAVIDRKGVDFQYLKNHILLIEGTDDIFIKKTEAFLKGLIKEMDRRLELLKPYCFTKVQEFNEEFPEQALPYIVLVIDEMAQVKSEKAQECITTLLQMARCTGICQIYATQRPSATMFSKSSVGDIKANLRGRLCFEVASGIDSNIILDDYRAKDLPHNPGRAIWKVGRDFWEVQCPHIEKPSRNPEVLSRLNGIKPMKRVVLDYAKIEPPKGNRKGF